MSSLDSDRRALQAAEERIRQQNERIRKAVTDGAINQIMGDDSPVGKVIIHEGGIVAVNDSGKVMHLDVGESAQILGVAQDDLVSDKPVHLSFHRERMNEPFTQDDAATEAARSKQDEAIRLLKAGVVSQDTAMEHLGIDLAKERDRFRRERDLYEQASSGGLEPTSYSLGTSAKPYELSDYMKHEQRTRKIKAAKTSRREKRAAARRLERAGAAEVVKKFMKERADSGAGKWFRRADFVRLGGMSPKEATKILKLAEANKTITRIGLWWRPYESGDYKLFSQRNGLDKKNKARNFLDRYTQATTTPIYNVFGKGPAHNVLKP